MNKPLFLALLCVLSLGFIAAISKGSEEGEDGNNPASSGRVVVVSIDGLRPDAITTLGPEVLPNFYRLRAEGAFTDNARTDYDYTETLPNHTSMVTGRPVTGECGHEMTVNFAASSTDIHENGYIASMFDVAHDHGFSTALFIGKTKLAAISGSYTDRGANDITGEDNGTSKIDTAVLDFFLPQMVDDYVLELAQHRWELSMLHIRLPDSVGHVHDWNIDPASQYMDSIVTVDGYLGQILDSIESTPGLAGATSLIVTSDHGGEQNAGLTHTDPVLEKNYTIPFYVWGPGVKAGGDLYDLNPDLVDPGTGRPDFNDLAQPIRNGMVGNLALDLLGLPPIPGSCFNVSQQLRVSAPPCFSDIYPWLDPDDDDNGNGYSNFFDYALGANPQTRSRPDLMPRMDGNDLLVCFRTNTADVIPQYEFSGDLKNWGPLVEGISYIPISSEEIPEGRRVRLLAPTLGEKVYYRQTFRR